MAERTAQTMIETIDRYFDTVDNGDVAGTLAELTPDCTISVITDGVTHDGRDAIKAMFERRLENVNDAWHGNRRYVADPETGLASTRFDVRRTSTDGSKIAMDNINFFEFEGNKLRRISIWMSGENTLR
ncbi:MAG: nuclear transport factor 2 family protein [Alphaproteobacteria bacterium]